jgi:hypothetical protein
MNRLTPGAAKGRRRRIIRSFGDFRASLRQSRSLFREPAKEWLYTRLPGGRSAVRKYTADNHEEGITWSNHSVEANRRTRMSSGSRRNDPERPDQAGWGGRFVRQDSSKNHWHAGPAGTQAIGRWRPEVPADFARCADSGRAPLPPARHCGVGRARMGIWLLEPRSAWPSKRELLRRNSSAARLVSRTCRSVTTVALATPVTTRLPAN